MVRIEPACGANLPKMPGFNVHLAAHV